jgi:hypothetical protein
MANRSDDLVLHLKLDDINIDGKTGTVTTPDSARANRNGKVSGFKLGDDDSGAILVADDTFGACLILDGKRGDVEVSDAGLGTGDPPHTIEAWIKVESVPDKRQWILLLGQEGKESHHWLLKPKPSAGD